MGEEEGEIKKILDEKTVDHENLSEDDDTYFDIVDNSLSENDISSSDSNTADDDTEIQEDDIPATPEAAPYPGDYDEEEPPPREEPDDTPEDVDTRDEAPRPDDDGTLEEAPRPEDDDDEPPSWDEPDQAPDPALDSMADETAQEDTAEEPADDGGKLNYADITKKRINRGQKFQRTKTMGIIFIVIACLMLLFTFGSNLKKKQPAESDMGKAGKVYIPDMVQRITPRVNGEKPPPPEVKRSDDELLENLETGLEPAPVAPAAPVSANGGYAPPTTNRNPLQKAVTRMPWNGNGQTAAPASNGMAASPYPQLPTPEAYLAQLQQRSAALGGQVPGGMYGTQASGGQNSYTAQNMQSDKERFANAGAGTSGYQWNSAYTLWKGTIIPAVLETGINSDLPGAVIARVTKNVYSSLDGTYLLIPEGSRLYALYNSNISYSQRRVQIAWNTLIRPDGFEIALGNMQGVDAQGYTGQKGTVSENFFEYLKAMGIISAFTVANGELDLSMQSLGTSSYTDQVVSENRNVINQLGAKLIDRALDIQPTITVKQGTAVNILTNVTIELPPLEPYPVTQKYLRH